MHHTPKDAGIPRPRQDHRESHTGNVERGRPTPRRVARVSILLEGLDAFTEFIQVTLRRVFLGRLEVFFQILCPYVK